MNTGPGGCDLLTHCRSLTFQQRRNISNTQMTTHLHAALRFSHMTLYLSLCPSGETDPDRLSPIPIQPGPPGLPPSQPLPVLVHPDRTGLVSSLRLPLQQWVYWGESANG